MSKEISSVMAFKEVFGCEMLIAGTERRRWKNVRDCFRTELLLQKEGNSGEFQNKA
jgi:hypothetical protein